MKSGLYVEDDVSSTAAEIAAGAIAVQPFGNIYAIVSRPDASTVRRVNLMRGRAADQAGSLVTTWRHLPSVYDWKRLPDGLDAETVIGLLDVLFDIGPFGFRGPAAAHIPDHLTLRDGAVRTTRLIAPGYTCRSNRLLTATMQAAGEPFLSVSPATRAQGENAQEPAHYRAEGVIADFDGEGDILVVQHRDEAAAQARYPMHAPLSATILAFHKLGAPDAAGRPTLIVERHGSFHVDDLAPIVGRWDFGLELAPQAQRRLAERSYTAPARHG